MGQRMAGAPRQELPLLIEVSLVGKAAEGVLPAQESFLVTVTPAAAAQAQADLAAVQQTQGGTDSTDELAGG